MPPSGHVVFRFNQLYWGLLDWLFPPNCAGCGKQGARWCASCQEKVQLIREPICKVCGYPIPGGEVCTACSCSRPHFAAARSWALYEEPLRSAIHQLKYRGNMAMGEVLSRPLSDLLVKTGWKADLVIPVPLGIARLASRGYNQSQLLAQPLAWNLGVPLRPQALARVRETQTQVGLNAEERKKNVLDAFQASPEVVDHRSVLVVDDVMTSGATLDACAQALRLAGAGDVFIVTLARAMSYTHRGLKERRS